MHVVADLLACRVRVTFELQTHGRTFSAASYRDRYPSGTDCSFGKNPIEGVKMRCKARG